MKLFKRLSAALASAALMTPIMAISALAEEAASDAAKKGLTTKQIVTISILGGLLLVCAVLCIIFREKVKKFLRVYKSEAKKIVWMPWDQTKKSTLVVLVVLVICALAICLTDFGLSKGFLAFMNLFSKQGL